jgi:hypothetical protein
VLVNHRLTTVLAVTAATVIVVLNVLMLGLTLPG